MKPEGLPYKSFQMEYLSFADISSCFDVVMEVILFYPPTPYLR